MKGYALDANIVSYALRGSERILKKIDEAREKWEAGIKNLNVENWLE